MVLRDAIAVANQSVNDADNKFNFAVDYQTKFEKLCNIKRLSGLVVKQRRRPLLPMLKMMVRRRKMGMLLMPMSMPIFGLGGPDQDQHWRIDATRGF